MISALPAAPEEVEDLSEFKFAKFAATFFQGNVGPQYSRKALKQSLLPLQTQGDQLVSGCEGQGRGGREERTVRTPVRDQGWRMECNAGDVWACS